MGRNRLMSINEPVIDESSPGFTINRLARNLRRSKMRLPSGFTTTTRADPRTAKRQNDNMNTATKVIGTFASHGAFVLRNAATHNSMKSDAPTLNTSTTVTFGVRHSWGSRGNPSSFLTTSSVE